MAAVEVVRASGVTLVVFSPAQLGVFGVPVAGRAGAFEPIGPGDVLARSGATAALDGPMFTTCGGQVLPGGSQVAEYAASRCASPDYLLYDRARGLVARGRYPDRGGTVAVVNGVARVARGAAVPPDSGLTAAVQGYPTLVWDGRNVTSPDVNAEVVWRAALVVLADGRLAFATAVASVYAFAAALVAAGARYAVYTDGGGSTAELVAGAGLVAGAREGRRVPAWLVVDPGGPSAAAVLLGTAALGLLGAGAWYYWRAMQPAALPAPRAAA